MLDDVPFATMTVYLEMALTLWDTGCGGVSFRRAVVDRVSAACGAGCGWMLWL